MSDQAKEILDNCDSPDQYNFYFDDPRYGYGIVVSSFAGPLGPIRPLTANGNHRSMAFGALGCPVVLAEVYDVSPPYRIEYNEDDDWEITRNFLKWQEKRGALRFWSRPVVRDGGYLELRVAEAVTPWLATSPRDAFAALDAYERFWDQKLETVGPLLVSELRQTWKFAARREVRKQLREKGVSAVTIVDPSMLIQRGNEFSTELERP